ncbi:LysR family transcriptional regulator [Anaerosacchariphilus polymeriproducens]|uniref:LysR family transcriptional regulator n=1 Tax=Anaerosacchariphilus polymeriproducens TaxID=1812858 RepID=A0A371AWA7_9FIRM|nr:LysR family transcriptional regulator [Anaerosacchariphilus polymeriproducens]RDU23819.1 LysR family transcriptional regulator [Anaerosacchariphilus polymeriproducens]
MEIRQMEYLIAAIETKSLNKAAEVLYTTQPNVSKVIRNLESELNAKIFIRSSKGISLTPFGEQLYEYAKNIVKNSEMVQELAQNAAYQKLKIASYPSNMVARNLTDFYMQKEHDKLHIEFQEGTAEEVIQLVSERQARIGIIYIAKKQEAILNRILEMKKLQFKVLNECELCLNVGPKNPYYHLENIEFEELKELKFVQRNKDYFSMVNHLETFSKGAVRMNQLKHMVHTNSDHCVLDMLLYTDLCSLELDFMMPDYQQYDIRTIRIKGCERCLYVGYISEGLEQLENYEKLYLESLESLFQ